MNDLTILSSIQMTSLEIAELVESRHDKVTQSIERLAERGVIKLPPMGEVSTGQRGPKTAIYIFTADNKRDSYVVVAQLSPEFTGRLVDRWQALETGEATPAFKTKPKRERVSSQLSAKMMIARQVRTALRMSDTSYINMISLVAESEGIKPTFLPSYVTGEALTKSMTDLLKDHGSAISRNVALAAMIALGLIEKATRTSRSSSTGTASFNILTDAGLAYGRNETSRQNPNETQVRLYVDKFRDLLVRIDAHVDRQPKTGKLALVAQVQQSGVPA